MQLCTSLACHEGCQCSISTSYPTSSIRVEMDAPALLGMHWALTPSLLMHLHICCYTPQPQADLHADELIFKRLHSCPAVETASSEEQSDILPMGGQGYTVSISTPSIACFLQGCLCTCHCCTVHNMIQAGRYPPYIWRGWLGYLSAYSLCGHLIVLT